jgi:chromosome segregation ATPase
MENDQLLNRIEWLDEELRKQKTFKSELKDQMVAFEGKLDASEKNQKQLDSEVTRLRTVISRVDDFDDELAELRVEQSKSSKEFERDVKSWIEDAKKVLRTQIKGVESKLSELNSLKEEIKALQQDMKGRKEEEERFGQQIREINKDLAEFRRSAEEQQRRYELFMEERDKERKRLVDIQGEVTSVRKRVDEQSGSIDLIKTDLMKVSNRIDDLEQLRRELKKEQESFLEQQSLRAAERDNTWRNWKEQIDSLDKIKAELDERIQKLDSTQRSVKQTREVIEDLSERVDRRVHEITEMQRLSEERFQQEWKMFKADDQKRWTNYTLNQQEQRSEIKRQTKDLAGRVTALEDGAQEIQDQIQLISTQSEQQLQGLLSLVRDWVEEYQQVMDSVR